MRLVNAPLTLAHAASPSFAQPAAQPRDFQVVPEAQPPDLLGFWTLREVLAQFRTRRSRAAGGLCLFYLFF